MYSSSEIIGLTRPYAAFSIGLGIAFFAFYLSYVLASVHFAHTISIQVITAMSISAVNSY